MTALLASEAPVKDSVTQYVIRRKADDLYYVSVFGVGPVWVASVAMAEHFDFMTMAIAARDFELDDDPDRFSIDAVQGER